MSVIDSYIDYLLMSILQKIEDSYEFSTEKWSYYKLAKSKYSTAFIAEKFCVNANVISDFELRWKLYLTEKNSLKVLETNSFRLIISLEYIMKSMNLTKEIELPVNNKKDDLSIKQVRVLELVIRDLIYEQIGTNELLVSKLSSLFNEEQIRSWVKNADETGLLSGTTFSELTNIFLARNIFSNFEAIFQNWQIQISSTIRETLRFAFEDIRVIRNQIAHNKQVTVAQIELLNIYFLELTDLLQGLSDVKIDIAKYVGNADANDDLFVSKLENDRREYWYSFLNYLKETDSNIESLKLLPSKNHWLTLLNAQICVDGHKRRISINIVVNNNKKLISAELFISSDENKAVFDLLFKFEYDNLNQLLRENVQWERLDEKKISRVRISKEDDFLDKTDWDGQFLWLKTQVESLLSIFNKYIN